MPDPVQLLRLYFEADRSAVRNRYQELYGRPANAPHAGMSSQQWSKWSKQAEQLGGFFSGSAMDDAQETEQNDAGTDGDTSPVADASTDDSLETPLTQEGLDDEFDGWVGLSAVTEEFSNALWLQWNMLDLRAKINAVEHFQQLFSDHCTLDYIWEGIQYFFPPWSCSGFLHSVCPHSISPVHHQEAVLSYQQLRWILDQFGIQYDDSEDRKRFEIWRSLSQEVNRFRQEHKLEPWQMWAIIYDLGPRLLPKPPAYPSDPPPRVWVVATNDSQGEFQVIDAEGPEAVAGWAINKKARRGDLALMYCVSPRSALVSVYRVIEDAHRDPFGGWNGYRGQISEKIPVPWIKFSEMRADPVLNQWKLVKGNFQGLLHYEVPENVWRRLLEMIGERDAAVHERLKLFRDAGKGVREIKVAEEQWTEKEVEDRLVIPILQRLGWKLGTTLLQQVQMLIKVGSGRPKQVLADFVGYHGAFTSCAAYCRGQAPDRVHEGIGAGGRASGVLCGQTAMRPIRRGVARGILGL